MSRLKKRLFREFLVDATICALRQQKRDAFPSDLGGTIGFHFPTNAQPSTPEPLLRSGIFGAVLAGRPKRLCRNGERTREFHFDEMNFFHGDSSSDQTDVTIDNHAVTIQDCPEKQVVGLELGLKEYEYHADGDEGASLSFDVGSLDG